MHKISWIHQFVLEIQQVLGSHELKGPAHFQPSRLNNFWNFNFPKIVSWYKKSAQSPIHSWDTAEFRVQWPWQILETYDLWDRTQFWPSSSNNSPLEFLQYLENIYINWQYTFSSRETYGLFDCEPCQSVFTVQKLRAK